MWNAIIIRHLDCAWRHYRLSDAYVVRAVGLYPTCLSEISALNCCDSYFVLFIFPELLYNKSQLTLVHYLHLLELCMFMLLLSTSAQETSYRVPTYLKRVCCSPASVSPFNRSFITMSCTTLRNQHYSKLPGITWKPWQFNECSRTILQRWHYDELSCTISRRKYINPSSHTISSRRVLYRGKISLCFFCVLHHLFSPSVELMAHIFVVMEYRFSFHPRFIHCDVAYRGAACADAHHLIPSEHHISYYGALYDVL